MSKTLKPITELNKNELLELLDNSSENHFFDYSNDVLDFISTFDIKSGEHQVLFPLIFNLYKSWSQKPIFRNNFGMELSKLFISQKHSKATIYRINKPKEYFLEKSVKKKQNKTKRKPWLKHFKKFVDKYELKSGSFYVKDIVLYNLYDKWVYNNNKRHPLSLFQFLKFCRLFFKTPAPKMIKSHEWFAINPKIQEKLTPDLINLMQQK